MRSFRFQVAAILFLFVSQSWAQVPGASHYAGSWIGLLHLPNGQAIHVVFNLRTPEVEEASTAPLVGTWSSPDQGGYTGKIDRITLSHDTLHLAIAIIKGTFDGVLSPDGNTFEGTLRQGMMPFPLRLDKAQIYLGTITDSVGSLRLAFKFASDSGVRIGVMESLDEAEVERPIDSIRESNDDIGTVKYRVSAIDGVFLGSRSMDGNKIVGTWTQHGEPTQLTLLRTEKLPVVRRPQDPVRPYPYNEEEVSYMNPAAGITIGGTLTLPKGKGPFPVVLMITGSGQQDRDEFIMGHRTFWVIADYLTRRGIAVLRVDDRGIGATGGAFDTSTTLDFASDTRAGVAYLRSRKDINPRKIGLIGHSEGGIIAPMVAADDKDIAFIVLMAAPGIPSRTLMDWQRRTLLTKGKHVTDTTLEVIKAFGTADSLVASMQGNDHTVRQQLDSVVGAVIQLQYGSSDTSNRAKQMIKQYTALQVRSLLSPWHRYFIAYDPKPVLLRVKCPVLAIDGSLDQQVNPKEDLDQIGLDLREGGDKNYTIKELPNLNHLFQTARTGSIEEYPRISETVAPIALKAMGDWIEAQTKN